MLKIKLIKADISKVEADAIVNAANTTLLGGGGVDGTIHRAAGPNLLEECRTLSGCRVGEAKITRGYNLPAKFVIHTVGPVWRGGTRNEAEFLKNCYLSSLRLAEKHEIKSIAFPAISTGTYGYPKEEAAKVAISTVKKYLKDSPATKIKLVILVVHSDKDFELYQTLMH